MEYVYHYDSPLGGITLSSDGHRVGGSNGSLTGYGGGIDKKSNFLNWKAQT